MAKSVNFRRSRQVYKKLRFAFQMNQIKKVLRLLSSNNTVVIGVFLISAIFVICLRSLSSIYISFDDSIQIEAAHRLANGNGLTTIYLSKCSDCNYNISARPNASPLTWWPPGYSVLVSVAFFAGLPLVLYLKALFSLATLVGWFGWSVLGSRFLDKKLKIKSLFFPVNILIAVLLPIFYTPPWTGTDIFLWSAVPLVVILLVYSTNQQIRSQQKIGLIIGSGIIAGTTYNLRYASLFLVITGFLTILHTNLPNFKSSIKSVSIFLASFFLAALPTVLFNQSFSGNQSSLPEYINASSLELSISGIKAIIVKILVTLSGLRSLFRFLLFDSISIGQLDTKSFTLNVVLGILSLTLFLGLYAIILRTEKFISIKINTKQLLHSIFYIPLSLLILLALATLKGDYGFIFTDRYYIPAGASVLLIICAIYWTLNERTEAYVLNSILKKVAITYILIFILYNLFRFGSLVWDFDKAIRPIIGYPSYTSLEIPGNKTFSKYPTSYSFAQRLSEEYPTSTFYFAWPWFQDIGNYDWRKLPNEYSIWQKSYTDKSIRLFFVIRESSSDPGHSCDYSCIKKIVPNLKLVKAFPEEYNTMILTTTIPAGYHFKTLPSHQN